jgi:hypothetical protein
MRIENLRSEKVEDRARVGATILWEDCDRPAQNLYFETIREFELGLDCNPNAFLVACLMPAFYFEEERISVEGNVCPDLRNGLNSVMSWIRFWWYDPSKKLVTIEAKTAPGYRGPRIPERAGFLFSGGIDSLATLRSNRLTYPPEHPGWIKDGLLVCGLEIREQGIFDYVMDSVSRLGRDAGIAPIPLYTNIRSLGPEDHGEFWGPFWLNEFMGAAFAATGHVLARRMTELSINSCHDIPNLIPYSSHPLINPNYSSRDLRVRHEGIPLSRLEKPRLVAGWELGLQNLRVCNRTEL